MRALLLGVWFGVALLVLAGCGSSSGSYPSLGSKGGNEGDRTVPPGWISLSGNTYSTGTTDATVSAQTVNPLQLRLQVTAAPDVQTQTSYEIDCDTRSAVGPKLRSSTPITREIRIPPGGSGDVECSITATATKPVSATMTVSLIARLPH